MEEDIKLKWNEMKVTKNGNENTTAQRTQLKMIINVFTHQPDLMGHVWK